MDKKNSKRPNPAEGGNGSDNKALLLIDVISDFDFKDGDRLYRNALPAANAIAGLKERANRSGLPVIYVNDNYGKWREDLDAQIERIIDSKSKRREVVELLTPGPDDYYVLKPQRSGFYETPLAVLLASLEISEVIITGFTTDICVLFTAHDAHMRGFAVRVPSDCAAAVKKEFHEGALELLERVADVDTAPSKAINIGRKASRKKGAHA